jgi:hypothetical protein
MFEMCDMLGAESVEASSQSSIYVGLMRLLPDT